MSVTVGAVNGVAVPAVQGPPLAVQTGGGVPFGPQQAYMGAYMPPQQGGIGNILKKALAGGLVGAGVGAGIGFIASHIGIPIPFLGGLPGFAAGGIIGGLAGAAIGAFRGFNENRRMGIPTFLPKQSNANIPPGAGVAPPPALAGKTLKFGDRGALVKTTQRALKQMGVYAGKITGRMDKETVKAIQSYEVAKGAMPSGKSTPDLRAVLQQDIRALKQYT